MDHANRVVTVAPVEDPAVVRVIPKMSDQDFVLFGSGIVGNQKFRKVVRQLGRLDIAWWRENPDRCELTQGTENLNGIVTDARSDRGQR